MRERQSLGGHPWIAAEDDTPVAETKCSELQCSYQYIQEGAALVGSPGIAAVDDAPVLDTGECELKFCH